MVDIRDPNVVQTEELCIEAVKKDGYALEYVNNQTEAICMEAVKRNGYALQYVHNRTEAICMEAVKQNGYALEYVHNRTEAICMEAVKQNGLALQFVEKQTEDMCMEAVRQYGTALEYVKNQTEAICMESVKEDGLALEYVHNQTEIICLCAVDTYFKQEMWWHTVKDVYKTIKAVKYPSPQLIVQLVKLYPSYTDTIMSICATDIMTTYKAGSDVIVTHLVPHANDLLYKPNSVNALVSNTRWHTTTDNAKTLFLTKN